MPTSDSTGNEDAPAFRSPKRALARSFRLSRDRWKEKAGQRRQQIKSLQVRVRDLQASRDLWKDKALHLQRQLDQLLGLASAGEDSGVASPPEQAGNDFVVPASVPQPQADLATPPSQPGQVTTPSPAAEEAVKKTRMANLA
jgi:hypothetical protein